jgi:hypothetical protein
LWLDEIDGIDIFKITDSIVNFARLGQD